MPHVAARTASRDRDTGRYQSHRPEQTLLYQIVDEYYPGNKLEGYNTVDFIGSYALPVGKLTFSIENLLNEDYVTIWGQRAPLLYSPTYGSSSLYEYKGRGRTFGLNYALTF